MLNSAAGILVRSAILASVILGLPLLAMPAVRDHVVTWWQDPARSIVHRPATVLTRQVPSNGHTNAAAAPADDTYSAHPSNTPAQPPARLTPQHQPDDPVLASPSEQRVQPAAASMLLETPAPRHNPPVTVRPRQVPPHDALSPSPVPPSAAGNLRHPDTMPRETGSPPDAAAAPPLEITADLQQQLELMGARHLVVERLGDSGLYRCICLADVPGTTYQRPFTAEDLVPERALQRVLSELEHWYMSASQPRAER